MSCLSLSNIVVLFLLIRNVLCLSQIGKVLERDRTEDSVCILRNDMSLEIDGIAPSQCRCNFTKLSKYEYECSKGDPSYMNHRICREKPCQICCKLLLSMGITNEPAILCKKRCFGSPEVYNVTESVKYDLPRQLWEFSSLFKQNISSKTMKEGK